jgi:hypothetical protein
VPASKVVPIASGLVPPLVDRPTTCLPFSKNTLTLFFSLFSDKLKLLRPERLKEENILG